MTLTPKVSYCEGLEDMDATGLSIAGKGPERGPDCRNTNQNIGRTWWLLAKGTNSVPN
jgi:hypothetical protein